MTAESRKQKRYAPETSVGMPVALHIASSDPEMAPVAVRLRQLVESAVLWVNDQVGLPNIDIVAYRNPMGVIPEIGVCGFSPTANLVLLSVDPMNDNFSKGMDITVPATIVHELHHCLRWSNPGYGETLREALVTEGLAQHFETDFRKGVPPFYSVALDQPTLSRLESQARKEYDKQSYSHSDWFFGSVERGIPRFAGYSLGFHLVGRFLKASGKNAAVLCHEPAANFQL